MLNTIRVATVLALLLAVAAFPFTTYTRSVTNITSVTIPVSDHGINSKAIAVTVKDQSSNILATTEYTLTISDSYSVTVQPSSTPFTGTIELRGPFDADTTGTSDFKCQVDSGGYGYYVCPGCSSNAPAVRIYNNQRKVALNASHVGTLKPLATVYTYIKDNKLWFHAAANSGEMSCSGPNCAVAYGASGYPASTIHLCTVTTNGSGAVSAVQDDRPTGWQ